MSNRARSLVLCCMVCGTFLAVPSLQALWIADGTPVVTASESQRRPAIASDGRGGAVVVWEDDRDGTDDIYAQRLDARGAPVWANDGVVVCDEPTIEMIVEILPDGEGGAFINWLDVRDGDFDVYIQRVDSGGSMLWADNGLAVCGMEGEQQRQRMISDGAGGIIIAWDDLRNGEHRDIYAQRIDAGGSALWGAGGMEICTAEDYQDNPVPVSDGAGGAVIIWSDCRHGNRDVYAQRVDADGNTLWTDDGVAICTDEAPQYLPLPASDGSGGAIVVWQDTRDAKALTYAQRVSSGGSAAWIADGIPVCTLTTPQYYPAIATDDDGGAIIAWEQGSTNRNIHAQRVGANGDLLWTANGVGICSEAYTQGSVQVFPDGGGGAFLVWIDTRNGNADFYAQRVDADGNLLWPAGGAPVCTDPATQSDIACALNGAAGMIFAWEDYRSGIDLDIYSSMMGMDGLPVATLLQGFELSLKGRAIVVDWTLSESVDPRDFTVSRTETANVRAWAAIPVDIDENGAAYSFTDDSCLPGTSYSYRVELFEEGAGRVLFETEPTAVPGVSMTLYQNRPNPFNPSTTIRFYLPERTCVALCVYDISGRLVSRLVPGVSMPEGFHEAVWDGGNDDGSPVASGIYLCRLEAGKSSQTRKMILLR